MATKRIKDFINTKSLTETARLVTQSFRVGSDSAILIGGNAVPRAFPDTLAASFSGSRLVVLGEGMMNSDDHAAILTQFAFDRDRDVATVSREYIELISLFGRDRMAFRKVVAAILGSADRPTTVRAIQPVTPTFVLTTLQEVLQSASIEAEEIYMHLLTDFVCHLLRPFGWITADAGYVHRIHRVRIFPRFEDIVNVLAQQELSRILSVMQRTDMSVIKRTVDAKQGLSPAMISSYMASALLRAYELSRSTYDATSVAATVLTLVARIVAPDTPIELYPAERIVKSELLARLTGNFAIVLAAQDMLTNHPQVVDTHYGDEEIVSQVLPMFQNALVTNAVFKVRIASDVVDFLGKRSSIDRLNSPRKVAIYEAYDSPSTVEVFSPIKHLRDDRSRYLNDLPDLSGAMSALMKPVAELFSTREIVEQRMVAFDTAASELQDKDTGVDIYVAFPSLTEREVAMNLPAGSLMLYLQTGEVPDLFELDSKGGEDKTRARDRNVTGRILDGMAYDHYAMLMHLALLRASSQVVSVISVANSVQDKLHRNIAVMWEVRTQLPYALGESAIVGGTMSTAEPLEAIVYQDDYEARKHLAPSPLKIADYRDHVHIWDWHTASTPLASAGTFVTRLGGKNYTVVIEEHEMLGMGVRRKIARFVTPHATAAVARMWCDWIDAEGRFVDMQAKRGDDLTRAAFRGLGHRSGISLVAALATIGAGPTGNRITSLVRRRLADQMYANNSMDEIPRLSVGIYHARLRVWAGLQTLGILGLLTNEMIEIIYERIKTTDAMAAFVSIDRVTQRLSTT